MTTSPSKFANDFRDFMGRLPAHGQGEDKDSEYPLRAALPRRVALPAYKYWPYMVKPLAQGPTGTCVAHGLKNWMMSAPVQQTKPDRPPFPYHMYKQFVLMDEWADNDSEADGPDSGLQFGTSVRAGFKWAQSAGYVAEYRWAANMQDVIDFLSIKGPIVIGINWYEGMFTPDAKGYLNLYGEVAGGHCVTLLGRNNLRKDSTLINSWGAWGKSGNGRAMIRDADLQRLLFSEGGEAAAGLEVRLK